MDKEKKREQKFSQARAGVIIGEMEEAVEIFRKEASDFAKAINVGVAQIKAQHARNYETALRAARGGRLPAPFIPARQRKTQKR